MKSHDEHLPHVKASIEACRAEYELTMEVKQVHLVKSVEPWFEAFWERQKTAEVRFDDRNYQVGDLLVQRRWTGTYFSGSYIVGQITHIVTHQDHAGIAPGHVMLSIKPDTVKRFR